MGRIITLIALFITMIGYSQSTQNFNVITDIDGQDLISFGDPFLSTNTSPHNNNTYNMSGVVSGTTVIYTYRTATSNYEPMVLSHVSGGSHALLDGNTAYHVLLNSNGTYSLRRFNVIFGISTYYSLDNNDQTTFDQLDWQAFYNDFLTR